MINRGCLLLLALLPASWGVYLNPCLLDLEEHTTDFPITCHDVRSQDQVKWQYQHDNGSPIDVGFCNPVPESCVLKLENYMTITRPWADKSVLVVKNATRDLSGAMFTCMTFANSIFSDKTTCRMNIIRVPDSVSITMHGSSDTVTQQETPGKSLSIACVTEGYPCPSLSLLQDGVQLHTEKAGECFKQNYTSLHFDVIATCESTGNYSCTASNSAGQRHADVMLNIQCAPRKTFAYVATNQQVRADRNVTVGVISNPSPTTFTFQRLEKSTGEQATNDPEPANFLRSNCKQTGVSSQHICTIFMVGHANNCVEGEYDLDIGNSMGNLPLTFQVKDTVETCSESSGLNQRPETAAAASDGVIAGFAFETVLITALVVGVIMLVYKMRQAQGVQETSRKQQEMPDAAALQSQRRTSDATSRTAASVANPSDDYVQWNNENGDPNSQQVHLRDSGPPSSQAPSPPSGQNTHRDTTQA